MSATTIKLEGDLLKEIVSVKAPDQSLTAFVRETLECELRQRKLRMAAETYQRLIESNEIVRNENAEWQSARLEHPVGKQK